MEKGEVTGGNMTKEQIEAQKAYMSLEEDIRDLSKIRLSQSEINNFTMVQEKMIVHMLF